MHAKFINISMHASHVIPNVLTKWHIQLLHILAVILFLIPAILEF
jgi:hypothetical protein